MNYVVIAIFYLIISGIIIGIATHNHDVNNKELDDMTRFEKVVAGIALFPLWVVIVLIGVPMMIVYFLMHEGYRK